METQFRPRGSDGKESACNAGELVWPLGLEDTLEEEMQPTPVLLPREFHGERIHCKLQSIQLSNKICNFKKFTEFHAYIVFIMDSLVYNEHTLCFAKKICSK